MNVLGENTAFHRYTIYHGRERMSIVRDVRKMVKKAKNRLTVGKKHVPPAKTGGTFEVVRGKNPVLRRQRDYMRMV